MLRAITVRQVLLNLLINAVHYTAEGTIALRVAQHRQRSPVRGRGHRSGRATEQAAPLVPGDYDRLDMPESGAGGTGLGLSINQRFVGQMGGKIGPRRQSRRRQRVLGRGAGDRARPSLPDPSMSDPPVPDPSSPDPALPDPSPRQATAAGTVAREPVASPAPSPFPGRHWLPCAFCWRTISTSPAP